MKRFKYDVILAKDEICNLKREHDEILKGIDNQEKLIIYGPRNYGKTSLLQNVIIPKFLKHHERAFALSVDLMQVKTLDSISDRVRAAFERSFAATFPGEALLKAIKAYLSNFRATAEIDPTSNNLSFSIAPSGQASRIHFIEILRTIRESIATKIPTLIVLDEFQDISLVDEAEGMLRSELQKFNEIPVVFMGSKRHILGRMFGSNDAPFANFGRDIEFLKINYSEYHQYIVDRFEPQALTISEEVSKYLQDRMNRIPEAINIIGAKIVDIFSNREIKAEDVDIAITKVVEERQSRYTQLLGPLSENEQSVMRILVKVGPVSQPTSKHFLALCDMSPRGASIVFENLENLGFIEKQSEGFQLVDPLLATFISTYR